LTYIFHVICVVVNRNTFGNAENAGHENKKTKKNTAVRLENA